MFKGRQADFKYVGDLSSNYMSVNCLVAPDWHMGVDTKMSTKGEYFSLKNNLDPNELPFVEQYL